jgi:hypothetical protein
MNTLAKLYEKRFVPTKESGKVYPKGYGRAHSQPSINFLNIVATTAGRCILMLSTAARTEGNT